MSALDEFRVELRRALCEADSLDGIVATAVGTASICWENVAGAGTTKSNCACVVVEVLTDVLRDRGAT